MQQKTICLAQCASQTRSTPSTLFPSKRSSPSEHKYPLTTQLLHFLTLQRHGNPQELLAGPFLYGIVHTAATLITFTSSPAAVVALSALCAGDGLADVAGRRFGRLKPLGKLPWSPGKVRGQVEFIGVWAV